MSNRTGVCDLLDYCGQGKYKKNHKNGKRSIFNDGDIKNRGGQKQRTCKVEESYGNDTKVKNET